MITSKQNSLIKTIRSLRDKKYRDELGLYIVEGIKMTREAVLSGMKVRQIICSQKMLSQVESFFNEAETVTDELMEYVSCEVTPQGVLAVVETPQNTIESPQGYCVFLDGVSDPSNVGAIIRSAAAAGFTDVYLSNSADAFAPKAVRSSMSGIFKVRTHIGDRDALLKKINIPIVCADMGGVDIKEFNTDCPVCLVIGNEARGVSSALRSMANHTVSLKMDNDMESLNASVSASILMYALVGKV